MKRLALVLLAASCAQVGPVLYRTPCGVQVRALIPDGGWPADWSEQRLRDAETEALAALKQYGRNGVDVNACAKLANWNLYPYPSPTWRDPYGRKVAGVTNCSKGLSIIGSDDPRRNALAHELAHAIQRCSPPQPPIDEGLDSDHADWNRDGINDAIEALYRAGQVYRSAASVRDAGQPVHALPSDWPEVLR